MTENYLMTLKERNNPLYSELRSFTNELIQAVADNLKGKNVPMHIKSIWQKKESEDRFVKREEEVPYYFPLLIEITVKMSSFQGYKMVAAEIENDECWSKYFNKLTGCYILDRQYFQINGILLKIAEHSLTEPDQYIFSEEKFEAEVDKIEKFFQDPMINYVKKIPLYGIIIEKNISISNDLSIEILSDADVMELIEYDLISSIFPRYQSIANPPRVAITFKSTAQKHFLENNAPQIIPASHYDEISTSWSADEQMIISLLATILNTPITPVGAIEKLANSPQSAVMFRKDPIPNYSLTLVKKTLTKVEESKFHACWKVIANKGNSKSKSKNKDKHQSFLRIALRRYALAISEKSLDDKLIDLMICAEAL